MSENDPHPYGSEPAPPPYVSPPQPPVVPQYPNYAGQQVRTAPTARRRRSVWVVLLVVALVLAGGALAFLRSKNREVVRYQDTAEERQKATVSAFSGDAPVNVSDPRTLTGITTLFNKFTTAAKKSDGVKMVACFDIDRLCDEVVASGIPGTELLKDKRQRTSLGPILQSSLRTNAINFAWDGFIIRQVKPLADDAEVLVYLRADLQDGYAAKFRAWLRRDGNDWRIYDYEDLSFGMRATGIMSIMMAAASRSTSGNMQQIMGAASAVRDGAMQLAQNDPAAALRSLRFVDGKTQGLPAKMEALRLNLIAAALNQTGESAEALKMLERAEALSSDQPLLHLVRGAAYVGVDEPEKALESLKRYEEQVGPEALSYYHSGTAHLMLGDRDKALRSFRNGLDDTANSTECFEGLCRVLGTDGMPEIRQRLTAFKDPSVPLRSMGNLAIERLDTATLETAVALFPDDSDPFKAYFQAEAHVLRRQYGKALEVFERHASRFKAEPELAEVFQSEYGITLIRSGRVLEGVAKLDDKALGLVEGGDLLVARQDAEQLSKLLALVKDADITPAIVDHYSALLADLRKQPDEAVSLLRKAMAAQTDAQWTNAHRRDLVRILATAGRHLEAYDTVLPKWDVYLDLVRSAGDDLTVLRELVARAGRDFASEPKVAWDRSTIAWLEKDYARCTALLLEHRAALTQDPKQNWSWAWSDRLVRSLVRQGKAAEALKHLESARPQGNDEADSYLHILAFAASGNVPETTRRLTQLLDEEEITLEEFLDEDEDLTQALSSPAFARFKAEQAERRPKQPVTRPAEPGTRPATTPAGPAATPTTSSAGRP